MRRSQVFPDGDSTLKRKRAVLTAPGSGFWQHRIGQFLILGLLLSCLTISSIYQIAPRPVDSPAALRQVDLVINGVTGPDLVATRANPGQPQNPSPFRF